MFVATTLKRFIFFLLTDVIATYIGVYVAFLLRFDFSIPLHYTTNLWSMVLVMIMLKVSFFYLSSLYKVSWRHFSFHDSIYVALYSFISTLLFLAFVYILRDGVFLGFPRSVIPIEFFISVSLILSIRMLKRFYLEIFNKSALGTPTLIVASVSQAAQIIRKLQETQKYWVVALYDEVNEELSINGIEFKSFEQLKHYHIGMQLAIISDEFDIDTMYKKVKKLGIKEMKIYNSSGGIENNFKNLSVEDFLARNPKDLDKSAIEHFIKDKIILVTGAGGSIGSEIARQCAMFQAKQLLLLDHSEFNLYQIEQELSQHNIIPILQSVVNKKDLEKTFQTYKPEIVIHAAAYKHVPLVEVNVKEAIQNNVLGTKNTIDCSIEYGVEKFVLISTDKAVRPTNVMGTTKRICELYAQNVEHKQTEIVSVRFGNVLGSSGSVIPKFQKQIQEGKNITVTHPEITRYFMLIPEACALVLQAGAIGKGGELFILDMGEPIKIVDLAKKMIELSGRDDIKIEFSGLRAGEKLYEELLIDESNCSTKYDSIMVAPPTYYAIRELKEDIQILLHTDDEVKQLQRIVPEFKRT